MLAGGEGEGQAHAAGDGEVRAGRQRQRRRRRRQRGGAARRAVVVAEERQRSVGGGHELDRARRAPAFAARAVVVVEREAGEEIVAHRALEGLVGEAGANQEHVAEAGAHVGAAGIDAQRHLERVAGGAGAGGRLARGGERSLPPAPRRRRRPWRRSGRTTRRAGVEARRRVARARGGALGLRHVAGDAPGELASMGQVGRGDGDERGERQRERHAPARDGAAADGASRRGEERLFAVAARGRLGAAGEHVDDARLGELLSAPQRLVGAAEPLPLDGGALEAMRAAPAARRRARASRASVSQRATSASCAIS